MRGTLSDGPTIDGPYDRYSWHVYTHREYPHPYPNPYVKVRVCNPNVDVKVRVREGSFDRALKEGGGWYMTRALWKGRGGHRSRARVNELLLGTLAKFFSNPPLYSPMCIKSQLRGEEYRGTE